MSSPASTTDRKLTGGQPSGADRSDGKPSNGKHRGANRPGGLGRRRMTGVAAVEFALVVPLLLVILFGIIDFGFMLYDKAMLTNAAREGARAGIVLQQTRLTDEQVRNVALGYCQERMIRLGGGDGQDCIAEVTRPANIQSRESELRVSVRYTYDGPIVSLIGLIGGSLDLGTMSATAVMVYE